MTTTEHLDVREELRAVEMFSALEPHVLAWLAQRVTRHRWKPGEILVEQGEPGGALLVLISGSAMVYRSTGRSRAALAHLSPPAVLGEVTLLDGAARTATVQAVEPVEALELAREDLLELLRSEPSFLDALLQALGGLVRRLSDQAADHVGLDLPGRVAKTLVELSAAGPAPGVVQLTQSRIAELAGGSRQSLSLVLRGFATRGLVRVEGRVIVIQDMCGLRRRAGLAEPDTP